MNTNEEKSDISNLRFEISNLKYDERGLVPAVVQDAQTGEVLTLAYMNAESLKRTLESGETWFWSRSRAELWHKGETSGNTQRVLDVRADCDGDALLALVQPAGPACHTGARSCFHHEIEMRAGKNEVNNEPVTSQREGEASDLGSVLTALYALVETRRQSMPEHSYTTYLFKEGLDKILKKVGEESAETIIAAKNGDAEALAAEVSDLIYHLIVMLVERGVTLDEVGAELTRRSSKRGKE
ncbi:MAG TPA: bifunctional phosphoribosyl-AMP cyclohydrolase/phosphoribosyl-ATP diphosphatase HisIE [Pyrinomonadaceae bacterium]|nr:bifunctional phosphoribosyl-AMP cyclohydrolase/phosphoribosyl-ATP diphosphatase HisIE [Pyrinomonadaceae bacterium]